MNFKILSIGFLLMFMVSCNLNELKEGNKYLAKRLEKKINDYAKYFE